MNIGERSSTDWRGAAVAVAVFLLAACTSPPAVEGEPAPSATSLRPLSREFAVPAGTPPRSAVASLRYDLSSSGEDELPPDDGLPGDGRSREIFQRGGASWYGIPFHLRKTANGERFDMGAFTAAHRTLPFGTAVCVHSLVNGREVLVRINDRGPFGAGRIIDLSRAAADAIGMLSMGIKQVTLTIVNGEDMRCNGALADVASLQAAAADASAVKPQVATRRRR